MISILCIAFIVSVFFIAFYKCRKDDSSVAYLIIMPSVVTLISIIISLGIISIINSNISPDKIDTSYKTLDTVSIKNIKDDHITISLDGTDEKKVEYSDIVTENDAKYINQKENGNEDKNYITESAPEIINHFVDDKIVLETIEYINPLTLFYSDQTRLLIGKDRTEEMVSLMGSHMKET